ncbi:hypothetical protein [Devosia sp.]|uniref:hypothetical protein n=1 Tax=Devosia sp. TaxID=1871048 RepID=UPI001B0CDF22|nr:hypothetical protein [Devosia sp.]MBO9589055.1 hypothetical protein [Devosia sp.]
MSTQIAPISAAAHYSTSAAFWENHAKILQHQLDRALTRIAELEKVEQPPPPADVGNTETRS